MTGTDWAVIAGAVAAIVWVNWYFFIAGSRRAVAAAAGEGGAQLVTITVDGGYDPSLVRVKAGSPVRLVFDRRDRSSCSDEVVLPDFGVRRFLPTGEKTTIDVTPPAAGSYDFMCGMSMHRGRLIAEE